MPNLDLVPDKTRLMAHLDEFAKRIKLSGSAPELESFYYLQRQMSALGYHTELLAHDAWISLPVTARVTVNGQSLGCITHSMAPLRHRRASMPL